MCAQSGHLSGVVSSVGDLNFFDDILMQNGRGITSGHLKLTLTVWHHNHTLAIKYLRNILHSYLEDILRSSGAGELATETMHGRCLPLLQPGDLGLLPQPVSQVTDDQGHQKHDDEGNDVLGLFHGE